jgi:hypothetical protein
MRGLSHRRISVDHIASIESFQKEEHCRWVALLCEGRTSVGLDEVMRLDTVPAWAKFAIIASFFRPGGKKLRLFAADCAVGVLKCEARPGVDYTPVRDCINCIRDCMSGRGRVTVREMWMMGRALHRASLYGHAGFTGESRIDWGSASTAAFAAGAVYRPNPRESQYCSPRAAAWANAGWLCHCEAEAAGCSAGARAARERIQPLLASSGLSMDLSREIMDGATAYAVYYSRVFVSTRLPGWEEWESDEFAEDGAEATNVDIGSFAQTHPREHYNLYTDVFILARDAAIDAYPGGFATGEREARARVLSRMLEYLTGNPEPWPLP